MTNTISLLSLGCSKNRVDAEKMLFLLHNTGYKITWDYTKADVVIINTCGFINSAKEESIEEIFNIVNLKKQKKVKHIIVSGCLSERYKMEIAKELPEVDAVIGIGANKDIVKVVKEVLSGKRKEIFPQKNELMLEGKRFLTTSKHYAYLKIAEGCNNCCTYCAIPQIRGKFKSRRMEDIIEEAKWLCERGVKELILIAQDTTRYGEDIYKKLMLPKLLTELCKINKVKWLRILYCYPDRITKELLEVIKKEEKILNYIDLPLQHCSGRVLKAMNRTGNKQELTNLIKQIREYIPQVAIRTTFICGFPGETDEDFEELCEFVQKIKFERMGCFAYSKEENTKAFLMPNQVDDEIKQKRQEILMQEQMFITDEQCENMIGKELQVLVDYYDEEQQLFVGRSYLDAPDVDGNIYFNAKDKTQNNIQPGDLVKIKINGFIDGELYGEKCLN